MRRTAVLGSVAAVVAVAVAGGVVVAEQRHVRASESDAAARAAATSLASAWSGGDLSRARFTGTTPGQAQAAYAALTKGLRAVHPRVRVTAVHRHGDAATADLAVAWPLGTGWRYSTTAHLAPVAAGASTGPWGARYSAVLVDPALHAGEHLSASRTPAPRGAVLGRDGSPIVADSPVVEVGVEPSRTKTPVVLAGQLAGILGVDATSLAQRIQKAAPTAFVPVVTLRDSDYQAVRARLQPLTGTVFQRSTLPLAPTSAFARALLGRVGPATADVVAASHGRVAAGDATGLSGLQLSQDARLSGSPGTTVRAVSSAGAARTLFTSPAVAGQPVRTTLDTRVQEAADAALAGAKDVDGGPVDAALVAIDVPTGDVLAVANTPTSGTDRALLGHYPPGSTFKTVTSTALLARGITPGTVVACPPTITVDGRSFRNFEGEAFGAVPFRTDFAQSCNTAFIGASSRLGPGDLRTAAASLGIGGSWAGAGGLGVDAYTGSAPVQPSAVDRAAAAIGQGTVLASPMAMAQVAATIARGSWKAPALVTEPAPGAAASSGAASATSAASGTTAPSPSSSTSPSGSPSASPSPDAARLAVVRDLMRSVVTSGTASALSSVPGAPVYAKTGTAEYGSATPPRVDAWTVGFQGSTAFAVLVEDGTSGAVTAVPVVGAFLRAVDGQGGR